MYKRQATVHGGLEGGAIEVFAVPQLALGAVFVDPYFEGDFEFAIGEGLEDVAEGFGELGALAFACGGRCGEFPWTAGKKRA